MSSAFSPLSTSAPLGAVAQIGFHGTLSKRPFLGHWRIPAPSHQNKSFRFYRKSLLKQSLSGTDNRFVSASQKWRSARKVEMTLLAAPRTLRVRAARRSLSDCAADRLACPSKR
jgi:hypothetical protein